jgi:hypothetical protein
MPHIQQIIQRITNDSCLFLEEKKIQERQEKNTFLIKKFNFLGLLLFDFVVCFHLKNQN